METLQLWGEGFTNASVTAQKGKESWQLGVKKYHDVTQCNKPHRRYLLGKTQEVTVSAWVGSSRKLSRRQAYVGWHGGEISLHGDFQGGGWWDFKPSPGTDGFLCAGIGGFLVSFQTRSGSDILPYMCALKSPSKIRASNRLQST